MNQKRVRGKIDWMITLLPLTIIIVLCILFFFAPEQSNAVLSQIRFFFGDTFGTYYLVIGLGIFILSLYIACSKYGDIVLGEPNEKPQYSFFAWGSMMFTCNRQISRRIKKHLWLSNRSWARDVHSFGILHSWGALAGKSCSAQASSIWLIAGAFRRTQSK